MTWHLVTFADEKFKEKQDALSEQGKSIGFVPHSYTHDWLKKTEFYEQNKFILDQPRGLGYWQLSEYATPNVLVLFPSSGTFVLEDA